MCSLYVTLLVFVLFDGDKAATRLDSSLSSSVSSPFHQFPSHVLDSGWSLHVPPGDKLGIIFFPCGLCCSWHFAPPDSTCLKNAGVILVLSYAQNQSTINTCSKNGGVIPILSYAQNQSTTNTCSKNAGVVPVLSYAQNQSTTNTSPNVRGEDIFFPHVLCRSWHFSPPDTTCLKNAGIILRIGPLPTICPVCEMKLLNLLVCVCALVVILFMSFVNLNIPMSLSFFYASSFFYALEQAVFGFILMIVCQYGGYCACIWMYYRPFYANP